MIGEEATTSARELLDSARGELASFPGADALADACVDLLDAPGAPSAAKAHARRLDVALQAAALATRIIGGMVETGLPAGECDGPRKAAGLLMLRASIVLAGHLPADRPNLRLVG